MIPNLDMDQSDKIVLEFAYNDLKTYLDFENKGSYSSSSETETSENLIEKTEELKAFLKFWSALWVEKWKNRIAISQRIPKICRVKVCKLRNARAFYHFSKNKDKLKDNVIKRLIKKGEICMVLQIADELIIREIADHLTEKNFDIDDNLLIVLHGVFTRIEELQNEQKPVIYLKLIKKTLGYKLR
ncbi:MAG: hypothetical protein P8X91_04560 [Candidatus Bathyarchaeota archaeon]